MPVEFEVGVSKPRALRTAYTHLKVFRAPPAAGTYSEVTDATTRPEITDATAYTITDPAGSDTDYYRVSYWNARTGAESAMGTALQGAGDPALDIVSIDELRTNYLFGVKTTDDKGNEFPESLYRWYIKSAVSWLEAKLDMSIRPLSVVDERHDYHRESFGKFQFLQTYKYPIVEDPLLPVSVKLVFPSQPQYSRTYPQEWVQPDYESGHVEIVPGLGALSLPFMGVGGVLSPFVAGGATRYVPNVLNVSYTAGFARGQVPDSIKHLVGMMSAIGPLNIAGDLIVGAGIANYSMSLDGVSRSVGTTSSATNAGYGARVLEYQKELKMQIPAIRNFYKGIRATAA